MSPLLVLGVGLVGGAGALARFLLDGWVSGRLGREFPYGTLAVNVSGAFALGVLAGEALRGDGYQLAGVGFLGAFTTFSTWMFESQRLEEDGRLRMGALNVFVSLAAGLLAVWAGRELGAAL